MTLGPGSYDVAVSGAGNLYFHPLMAGSGYGGSTGGYNLLISAQALDLGAGSGPTILASNPAAGASPVSSPLAIRLDLSGPVHPSTVSAGSTVRLVYSPTGIFGDGNDVDVALASVNFSATVNELQLFPQAALKPGAYRVVLAGDSSSGAAVSAAPIGTPLGADTNHTSGQDLKVSFRVTGIEGGTSAADTLATAHDLGDVTLARRVQIAGALGTDPYYNAANPDPSYNPGNEVDFYHFHVDGTGRYAFLAEVFAGRIGSPLDAGVALYRVDRSTKSLQFVAGNNNSNNQATATDGSNPLLLDPALFASLTEGDYVVAVSSGFNTPSPLEGTPLNSPGLYNPDVSHSGQAGSGTGPYVLNLEVQPVLDPPQVVATSLSDGSVLTAPPTQLLVQFSEPVNLQQAGFDAYLQNSQSAIASVYVLGADGTKYFPRLDSIDPATNTATFLMLDALPNGSYELHLSGTGGLTDLGGNPLIGNNPGGDYVVHFAVSGHVRGSATGPLAWSAQEPTGGDGAAQDLGVLLPRELQAGVTVTRDPSTDPVTASGDTQDAFRFQVLQHQYYTFTVQGSDALPSNPLWLTDDQGRPVDFGPQGNGDAIAADLSSGVYVIHVGRWSPDQAAALTYQLTAKLLGNADNPVPLVDGPAPALQLRLNSLPGSGAGDPPASPISPTPTSPAGGTGSLGGSSGTASSSPTSPSPMSGPTTTSVVTGPAGALASSPATALAGNASSSPSQTGLTPGELIALSVAPVGSLHLPGSGAGDPPASPISPTPTSPAGGTGSLGGSSGTASSSPTSPSPMSGPTTTSVVTGPAGALASSPATALAGNASSSPSQTGLTPGGLIALSVAPVGSLHLPGSGVATHRHHRSLRPRHLLPVEREVLAGPAAPHLRRRPRHHPCPVRRPLQSSRGPRARWRVVRQRPSPVTRPLPPHRPG